MFYAQKAFLSEHCVALLDDDKRLLTFYWNRAEDINFNDIYICRVTQKMPHLKGYFAQTDHQRSLFIATSKSLQIGQFVRVVITKEQRMDKVAQAKFLSMAQNESIGLVAKGDLISQNTESQPLQNIPWEDTFDDAISESMDSIVPFADGARLIFEQTHAFSSIDVDSATCIADVHALNQQAATRIGQEIIKRNLSGNIIIDFIGHKDRKQMAELKKLLEIELNKSPTPYRIFGVSPMGNMEIRRDRMRMPVKEANQTITAICYDLFKQILKNPSKVKSIRISLEMHNALTGLLKNTFDQVKSKISDSTQIKTDSNIKTFELEYKP